MTSGLSPVVNYMGICRTHDISVVGDADKATVFLHDHAGCEGELVTQITVIEDLANLPNAPILPVVTDSRGGIWL